MKHRPHIDGLRALAVLPVILFHFGIPPFSGGYAGVDVFFVISGYLITGILYDAMRADKFSLLHFYERRARRILPALFLTCALSLIFALLFFMPEDFKSFSKSLEGVAGFASNFIFARNTGYFAESLSVKPLLHTWSLAVEEQFYVLFPLLLYALQKKLKSERSIAAALLALAALSFVLNISFIHARPERTFYLLHTRAWELMAGSLLRLYLQNIKLPQKAAEAVGLAGIALLGVCYVFFDRDTLFPGWAALVPTLAAMLLIWTGLQHKTLTSRLLSAKPLVLTGLVSYGLYLYHWPVLVFAHYLLDRAPTVMELIPLYVIIATLALFSYILVEHPARTGAMFKTRKTVFYYSGAGLVIFFLIGLAGFRGQGFPQRFSPAVLQYADGAKDTNWQWVDCEPRNPMTLSEKTVCTLGPHKPKPDYFVWGDSHLAAIEPAVAVMSKKHHKTGWIVAYSGCPSLLGATRADNYVDFDCPAIAEKVFSLIEKNHIETVLLVTRWDMYAEGWEKGGSETARAPLISYNGLKGRDAFAASYVATIARLKKSGVDVWVMKQVPPQLVNVPTALAKAAYFGRDLEKLQRPYAAVKLRLSFTDGVFEKTGGATFIDPAQKFCPKKSSCLIEMNGRSLYTDDTHVSVTGALWAKDMLEPFFVRK